MLIRPILSKSVIPACPESFFAFRRSMRLFAETRYEIPDALLSLQAPTSGAGMIPFMSERITPIYGSLL